MKSREFFVNNSIQNFQALAKRSPFEPNFNQRQKISASSSTKRIKRVTSCYNSTSKLDATKFINRQAFNSKLYSAKTFNIAVQFRKEKQSQSNQYFSFHDCEPFINLKKKLQSKENGQQFNSAIENVTHHLKNIYHNLNYEDDKSVRLIKQEMILLKEGFERVLKSLYKQIEFNEQKYLKMLFSQKSQQVNNGFSESRNLLSTKQSSFYSKTNYNQKFDSKTQRRDFENKPSLSSSKLKQSQLKVQLESTSFSSNNRIKSLSDKLSLYQFENKKHILRIQSLESQNSELKDKISQLSTHIEKMSQKVSKVKQTQQFYTYKIKKLKQQLEVAHIVKQQNLAEKMRYILKQQ